MKDVVKGIELLHVFGGDLDTVNIARVSFGKESQSLEEKDLKLIDYLAKHKHYSPLWSSYLFYLLPNTDYYNSLYRYLPQETFLVPTSSGLVLVISPVGLKALDENVRDISILREIVDRLLFLAMGTRLSYTIKALFDVDSSVFEQKLWQKTKRYVSSNKSLGFVQLLDKLEMVDKLHARGVTLNNRYNVGYLNWYRFRVKLPVFVARQLVKHCKGGVCWNERSGRYTSEGINDFYLPEVFRKQSPSNKQASTDETYDPQIHNVLMSEHPCSVILKNMSIYSANVYEEFVEVGIAKEQARMLLPQNMMTEVIWTLSKAALDNMIALRDHDGAQYETRLFAQAVRKLVYRT